MNAGQEFTIGSAFSDYIEAEIWADPGGSLQNGIVHTSPPVSIQ